jgi:hypothetical protein
MAKFQMIKAFVGAIVVVEVVIAFTVWVIIFVPCRMVWSGNPIVFKWYFNHIGVILFSIRFALFVSHLIKT